ncbi:MAG TPA: hypothetical protein PLB35_03475 [Myxococcota bacterium]|nr:hypothetical protein [Myxococcota bacterium]
MDSDGSIRQAGRGFFLITGAKLWFLLTATFTSLAFPRLFGDQVLFGQYRVVSGLLNVVTMVVITASVQAVSKLASQSGADLSRVRRTAMVGQTLVFGPVFLAFIAFHGFIASNLLSDPGIARPLLVSGLIVLAYMYYAAIIGLLNGTCHFGRQASMDILFSTLKTGLMIAAVVFSGSVALSYGAFAAAAWTVLIVAAFVSGRVFSGVGRSSRGGIDLKEYLSYLLPLAGYALVLNLLLQADVIALKGFLGRLSGHGGSIGAADAASAAAGVYGAAKNVALLPYQAVISLAFVVFPIVSSASSCGDSERASRVVSGAFRLASLLSWCAVAVFGSAPAETLGLLFGASYSSGAPGLVILLGAGAMLAFMHVGNAVLASSGRPIVSVLGGVGAAVVQIVMLGILLPGASAADATWLAAVSTLCGSASGAIVAGILCGRVFGFSGWVRSALSAAVSAVAALIAARLLRGACPWPVLPVVALAVFLAVLALTGGIGRADLGVLRRVMSRRVRRAG